jgi:hypothetical protein
VGGDRIAFSMSVDYLHATFDVENLKGEEDGHYYYYDSDDNQWYVSDDELDISGLMIQLGLTIRF